MDFNIKKPLHLLAVIFLIFAFYLLIISPILSFIGIYPSTQTEGFELSEIIILISSFFTVLIFVGVPIIWYIWVNNLSIREIFIKLKLKKESIDEAFLWGFLTTIIMLSIVFLIGIILYSFGTNQDEISNISDLANNISIISMFVIIIFQSISEEIFFRGFLIEKIDNLYGKNTAILTTSILFGIAHMTYGKIYPVLMPIVMGLLLGFLVYKTKNLFAAIVTHLLFNIISFTLYILAKSLGINALII